MWKHTTKPEPITSEKKTRETRSEWGSVKKERGRASGIGQRLELGFFLKSEVKKGEEKEKKLKGNSGERREKLTALKKREQKRAVVLTGEHCIFVCLEKKKKTKRDRAQRERMVGSGEREYRGLIK